MRYAQVCNGIVVNIILWDGEAEYEVPEGYELFEVSEEVAIGWTRESGQWIAPPLVDIPPEEIPVPAPEVPDEAKLAAAAELQTVLGVSEATARTIAGLPPL